MDARERACVCDERITNHEYLGTQLPPEHQGHCCIREVTIENNAETRLKQSAISVLSSCSTPEYPRDRTRRCRVGRRVGHKPRQKSQHQWPQVQRRGTSYRCSKTTRYVCFAVALVMSKPQHHTTQRENPAASIRAILRSSTDRFNRIHSESPPLSIYSQACVV